MTILYSASETSFTSLGLGTLPEAEIKVNEKLNGEYTIDMVYPASGTHFADIDTGVYVKTTVNPSGEMQIFRLETVVKRSDQKVEMRGNHISYELNGIPVSPFVAQGITETLNGFKTHSMITNPFTYWTDITNESSTYNQIVPQSARACLGGVEGSLLDIFRGEYEWDNFNVKVWSRRGTDNGVTIRYGKNLISMSQEKAIENVFTGVVSYWMQDDAMSTGTVQYVPNHESYPKQRIRVYDATSDFESQPSAGQLDTRSQQYISDNNIGEPKVSLDLSYIDLANTLNYLDLPIQSVAMGDTVHIIFEKLGVNTSARVVETTWNVNKNRYDSIVIGSVKSNIASTIYDVKSEMDSVRKQANVTTSIVQRIDADMGEISTTISQVTEDINGIQTNVSNLTQTAENLTTSVTAIEGDYVRQSTYEQNAEQVQLQFSQVNADLNEMHTYISFDANGVTVGKNDSNIRGVFGNDSLDFVDSSNTKLAWLSTSEGLGATELSVGDATQSNLRWRLTVSADGSHFRISRHT